MRCLSATVPDASSFALHCNDKVILTSTITPVSEIKHLYEVRPRKDHRGVDLISNALPFGRLWYGEPNDAIAHAKFRSRSHDAVQTHDAVIRVYDAAGNVIETHEHNGDFKE